MIKWASSALLGQTFIVSSHHRKILRPREPNKASAPQSEWPSSAAFDCHSPERGGYILPDFRTWLLSSHLKQHLSRGESCDSILGAFESSTLPHLSIVMCFGGGGANDTVMIRKRNKPRHHRDSYVSRPEVSSYRKETITRRSGSAHRPSRDHHSHQNHNGRRSGSRIVEERRVYRT